jgi:prolycopene isomerase
VSNAAPRDDAYDVIVIGSGLGGISAAALLAKAGRKVLVVERQDGPGGCAHAFRRGPYLFDPAIHVTAQAGEGELIDSVLRHLGVADRCTLKRVDHFYRAILPDFSLHAPFGADAFVATHVRSFPEEAEALRRFMDLCLQVHREAHELPPQLSLRELDEAAARAPALFKYLRSTLGEVMDEYLTDPRLKAVCSAVWPYVGSPPSRLSFVTFSQMLSVYLNGSYYCMGSFQNLADAFVTALEQNGGELVVGAEVTRILVEEGRAAGVELQGGERVRASRVISNADARRTLLDMVGAEHLPAALTRRLGRMQPSLSAFVLFAATNQDLGVLDLAHETVLYKHWDHEETYADILAGRPGGMWVNVPTLMDPSLAPPGEHLLILSALAAYDIGRPWEQEKERYTAMMLAEWDRAFPGLSEHLTFVEAATPLTLERFTLAAGGAIYGWELLPDQSGSKRLSHMTPIEGLYLSGHWTQPGAGSIRVIVSGVHTAQIVLASQGSPPIELADLAPI